VPAPKNQTADIRTKSVYEPAEPSDGHRVLVTQYWPRGVPKATVDEYMRALAPTRELLHAFKAGRLEWDGFRQQYLEQMRAPKASAEINRLAEQASAQPTTLICVCKDPGRCHRTILRDLITNSTTSPIHRSEIQP
jgi:uncharacterized protein YeaO (DUF488 family)